MMKPTLAKRRHLSCYIPEACKIFICRKKKVEEEWKIWGEEQPSLALVLHRLGSANQNRLAKPNPTLCASHHKDLITPAFG
jgi:hypothetical protein